MKCQHCRQENFAWARRCDHGGAAMPQTARPQEPHASATPLRDLAATPSVERLPSYCFPQHGESAVAETQFHAEVQDTESEGWKRLLELVETAAADGREKFAPFAEMTLKAQSQVITLPPTIGKLKSVRHLLVYGSCLVRIPPEIG